jgi:hypothetical protein
MSLIFVTLFTHAISHTKSKGLPIDVPIYLILFIRSAPKGRIIVLFIHSSHRHMKSKGHLYIYIYPSIPTKPVHTVL